jgi:hypothetical protein
LLATGGGSPGPDILNVSRDTCMRLVIIDPLA